MTAGHKISRIVKQLTRASIDSVFPRTCRVCGQSLTVDETLMCLNCRIDMPRTELHRVDFNTIHQRIGGSHEIGLAAGWFHYYRDSPYAHLIHEAKYGDRPSTARMLGRQYAEELEADGVFADVRPDVLLPVPLHRNKYLQRGYNQSRCIAEGMAEVIGCEVGDNLVAVRSHGTQTRRSGFERYKNVVGSYGVKHADELDGLRVAIVDDVVTTGSTLHDCVRAIAESTTPISIDVLTIGVATLR